MLPRLDTAGDVTPIQFAGSPLGTAAGVAARSSAVELPGKASFRTAAAHAQLIVETLRIEVVAEPIAQAWVEEMEYLLGSAPKFALDRAAIALGFNQPEWRYLDRQPRLLAAALLHASLVDGIRVFGHIRNQLNAQERNRLGRLIMPLWVELPTASALVANALGEHTPRIAIGTSSLELASHAIQRGLAHHQGLRVQKLPSTFGEGGASELIDELDRTIRADVGLLLDATPDEVAADLEATDAVVFALVAAEGVPSGILSRTISQLARRLPGIIFVLVAPPESATWRGLRAAKHRLTANAAAEREVVRQVHMLNTRMRDDD